MAAPVPPPAPVGYLVARDGPPPRRGLAYDYVLAGDGLYVAAENRLLEARVRIARAAVRGLPPLCPSVGLRAGRLPQRLWEQIVAVAAARPEREVLLAVRAGPAGYQLLRPAQLAGRARVVYRPPPDGLGVLLQVHSHGAHPACFSATDDADELGFGLYGVLGRLGGARPEVALRVGVYGYFLPVPWGAVFEGDPGPVRDVHGDPPDRPDGPEDVEGAESLLEEFPECGEGKSFRGLPG
jgi:PRTRC genetic system protein A